MRRCRAITIGLLFLAAAGCAHGRVTDGTFTSKDYLFSVVLPGAPYERVLPRDTIVALTDPASGVSFAIAASPDSYANTADRDKVLDYIARDLLFFLTNKKYEVFEDATLGGAPAKHMTVSGLSNGDELVVSAYVARRYGQIYDIVMWCPPASLEAASAQFKKMVDTFTFLRETGK
jgi:hypothetical protein